MSRVEWPLLFVVVAVPSAGAGYYAHVLRTQDTSPAATSPLAAARNAAYDFSKDTPCRVVRVVDGDTVDVEVAGKVERVRLIGVDTPESVRAERPVEFYSKEAALFTRNLLEGEPVYIRDGP